MCRLQERRPLAPLTDPPTEAQGPSGPAEREAQGPSGPAERETQGPPDPAQREEQQSPRKVRLVLIVAAVVIVLDQLTKVWAVEALVDGPIELFGSVRLALTTNTAGAFGLGGRFVPFLALGALGLVVVLATRSDVIREAPVAVAAGLVLGGALGNLIDRVVRSPGLLRGAVIDFVDVGFWPVFNLADSAITCGCLFLIFWSVRPARP